MKRFKIDYTGSSYSPFGLYHCEAALFGHKWSCVDHFETKEKAKECYELIKDLPEYLD